MSKKQLNIKEEAARCLLCENAPCSRACRVNGQAAGTKRGDLFEALHKAVFDEYFSATE